jgi:hypothetical protein
MTDQEFVVYFETAILPETLRIDQASTQFEVKDAVGRNIEMLRSGDKGGHARNRLIANHKRARKSRQRPRNPKPLSKFLA